MLFWMNDVIMQIVIIQILTSQIAGGIVCEQLAFSFSLQVFTLLTAAMGQVAAEQCYASLTGALCYCWSAIHL